MNTIWYEPFIDALRIHLEENHIDLHGVVDELRMTEEHFAYSDYGDDERVVLGCPFSSHCNCDWQVSGHVMLSLRDFK